jgi:multicomponent Na+:H+ antiporter subunit C
VTAAALFGISGATLVAIGVFGLVAHAHLLRRIIACNVIGSGIFLLFGAMGYRIPQLGADPVPQAMVITGIVVALAVTAVAIALAVRLFEETGSPWLPGEGSADDPLDD